MNIPKLARFIGLLVTSTMSIIAADLSAYQGAWIIAGGEFDGNPFEGEIPNSSLVVDNGKYTFELGDIQAKGTFTVDDTKSPALMTISESEGPNAGRTVYAITEATPNGWRACYSPAGSTEPPKSFATTQGSGLFLARYERKPETGGLASKPLKVLLV